jgi:hypothetical protein
MLSGTNFGRLVFRHIFWPACFVYTQNRVCPLHAAQNTTQGVLYGTNFAPHPFRHFFGPACFLYTQNMLYGTNFAPLAFRHFFNSFNFNPATIQVSLPTPVPFVLKC